MLITLNRPLAEIINDPTTYFNSNNLIFNNLEKEGLDTSIRRKEIFFNALALNIVKSVSGSIDFSKNVDVLYTVVDFCKQQLKKNYRYEAAYKFDSADFQTSDDSDEGNPAVGAGIYGGRNYEDPLPETGEDALIRAGEIVAYLRQLSYTFGKNVVVRIQPQAELLKKSRKGGSYWVPCTFCIEAAKVSGFLKVSDLIKEYERNPDFIPFKSPTNLRLLPFHPNCRCTYVRIDPDFVPKSVLDQPPKKPATLSDLKKTNNPKILRRLAEIAPAILAATDALITLLAIIAELNNSDYNKVVSGLFRLGVNESVKRYLRLQEIENPSYKEAVSNITEEQAKQIKKIIEELAAQKPTVSRPPKETPIIQEGSPLEETSKKIWEEIIEKLKQNSDSVRNIRSILEEPKKRPLLPPARSEGDFPEQIESLPPPTTLTQQVIYDILEVQSPDVLNPQAETEAKVGTRGGILEESPQLNRVPSQSLNQQLSRLNQEVGNQMASVKGDSSFYFESIHKLLSPVGEILYDGKVFDLSKKSDVFDLLRLSASNRKKSKSRRDQFEVIIQEALNRLGVPKNLSQSITSKIKILKDRNKDTRAYRAYTKAESNYAFIISLGDSAKTQAAVRNLELMQKKFLKTSSIQDELPLVQNIVQELLSWKNIEDLIERAKVSYFPPEVADELTNFYEVITDKTGRRKSRYFITRKAYQDMVKALDNSRVVENFYAYNNILILIASVKPEIFGLADVSLNPILLDARIQSDISAIMPNFGRTPPKQKLIQYAKVVDRYSKEVSQYLAILKEYKKYVYNTNQ